MSDINEIKEALAKITPGVWWHYQSNNSVVSDHKDLIWGRKTIAECNSFDDAKLLSNAPEWLASLITTIESQNSQIESLKAITELAVNELKKVSRHAAVYRYPIIELMVDTTLSEIERLQNGTT